MLIPKGTWAEFATQFDGSLEMVIEFSKKHKI